MALRVTLEVWSDDYHQLATTCRRAEALGFDAFYYGESPHSLNLECWTTLGALAASTSTVGLGPVIANILPTYRHTVLLARQIEAVEAVAGPRVELRTGVGADTAYGRGWWGPVGVDYPHYDQRLALAQAALAELADRWGDQSPPVTVAARGQRAMALAAVHADTWETSFCTPDELGRAVAAMAAVSTTAPRRSDRPLACSVEIDGFVAPTRSAVGRLLDRVQAERGPTEDLEPVLARALVGTPEEVAERLQSLARAGADQVVVALHDPHDPAALDTLAHARTLLPPP